MKFLYFFISLFCIFQTTIFMGSENPMDYGAVEVNLYCNPAAKKLSEIIETKQTLLGVSIDSKSLESVLSMLPFIAKNICLVKMCIEQYHDFSFKRIEKLKKLSSEYNFMILNDSKFADSTPETVKARYAEGYYKIADWAHFITVHFVEGSDILKHLKAAILESNIKESRGAFVITQTVNLLTPHYTETVLRSVQERDKYEFYDFLAGIIHVTNMPAVDKVFLKLQTEVISLDDDIQTIESKLIKGIKERRSNICFLKLPSNIHEILQKIPPLQNFCWEEYKKLNS